MTDDRRRPIRDQVRDLAAGGFIGHAREGVTSDLTIDEFLILHSIGWEPVELVCGVGSWPVPVTNWSFGLTGEVTPESGAWINAFEDAEKNLRAECRSVGGHGVVGVHIDITVERPLVNAVMVGTAVAPAGAGHPHGDPFASDLSCRDFALLHQYGWDPVGLAGGAAFVGVPRRSATTALRQSTQNIELTNYTEALYSAREAAMERMQHSARQLGAKGVVAVQVQEGPLEFAKHVISFTAWGTGVRPAGRESVLPPPTVVVALDEDVRAFEATSLHD